MVEAANLITAHAEDELLMGEHPETPYLEDARDWITIYAELLAMIERSLARIRQSRDGGRPADGAAPIGHDELLLTDRAERARRRLAFWRARLAELGDIELDPETRRLGHGGRDVMLTRREAELFSFLFAHPNRYFGAKQLVIWAWHAPHLSGEQLRSYMVRIRRHIQALELPAELVNEPGRGYMLRVDRKV